jgi:hypothetical protein
VLILPQRHKLDTVVEAMQERLDFDDVHRPRFKRYLELFVDYLADDAPDYITSQNMSFEERMSRYLSDQANTKND